MISGKSIKCYQELNSRIMHLKEEAIEPRPLGNIEGSRICIATTFDAVLVTKKKLCKIMDFIPY